MQISFALLGISLSAKFSKGDPAVSLTSSREGERVVRLENSLGEFAVDIVEIGKCDSCCFVIEEFIEADLLQSGSPSFAK